MDNDMTEIEMPPGAHRLPSGGWVLLSDVGSVNGRDVFNLRKGMDEGGTGSIGNAVLLAALSIRVLRWDIPNRPNLPIPRNNETWLQLVGWEDLLAMEKLVEDWTARILFPGRFAPKDDGQPGGPPAPDSE